MKSRTFLSQTQSNVSAHLPTFDDKLLKHNAVKWQLEKKKSGCHYSKNKTKQETKAQASENTRQQQSAVPSWLKIASKTYHGLFFVIWFMPWAWSEFTYVRITSGDNKAPWKLLLMTHEPVLSYKKEKNKENKTKKKCLQNMYKWEAYASRTVMASPFHRE